MGDLDEFAKKWAWVESNRIAVQRGNLPCPYGGGNCLISSPGIHGDGEDGKVYHLVACTKARAAQDGIMGRGRRGRELREMGCPRPEPALFSGWKCRYADGTWQPL